MLPQIAQPDYRIGVVCVLIASIAFGTSPALGSFAANAGLSPLATTAWRFLIPVVVLLPFLPAALRQGRLTLIGLIAGAAASLGTVAYFYALRHLNVATVSVIYFTYPLFTILLDRLIYGERIRPRAVVASVLIISAAVLVVSPASLTGGALVPLLVAFASPVGFAILIVILARTLRPIPVFSRASIGLTGAILGLLPGFLIFEAGPLFPESTNAAFILIGFAAATTLVPQLLYTLGSGHAGPGLTAIAGAFELVVALLVGWVWLGDPVLIREMIAGLLIVAALVAATVVRPRRWRVHS